MSREQCAFCTCPAATAVAGIDACEQHVLDAIQVAEARATLREVWRERALARMNVGVELGDAVQRALTGRPPVAPAGVRVGGRWR